MKFSGNVNSSTRKRLYNFGRDPLLNPRKVLDLDGWLCPQIVILVCYFSWLNSLSCLSTADSSSAISSNGLPL